MPVPLTADVADDMIAAASSASPACLIDWEAEGVEGADWRFLSEPVTWTDGVAPEDFVDLSGCTATVRVTSKRDGELVLTMTGTGLATGQVLATATSASATGLALATRGDRRCWWECDLTLPGGRHVWLWRGDFIIRQKGVR